MRAKRERRPPGGCCRVHGARDSRRERRQPSRLLVRSFAQPLGVHAGRRSGRASRRRSWRSSIARSRTSICGRTAVSTRVSASWMSCRSCRLKPRRWRTVSRWQGRSAPPIADRFRVPVYLYGEAAANPARTTSRRHSAGRVRGTVGQDGFSGLGAGFRAVRPASQRRRLGGRRADAPRRVQHQPRHRPARRRQGDRRRRSARAAAAALREGAWPQARDARDRAGLDEPDQLRGDADPAGVRRRPARGQAPRREGARERDRRAGAVSGARRCVGA